MGITFTISKMTDDENGLNTFRYQKNSSLWACPQPFICLGASYKKLHKDYYR